MTITTKAPIRSGIFESLRMLAIVAVAGSCCAGVVAVAEELPATAKTVEGLTLPDLQLRYDQNRLYFIVPKGKSTPGKITLPRLGNVVKSIRWIGDVKATMQVKSEPTEWTIDVSPQPANSSAVIVAELDAPVELFETTITARPDSESGIILLPAKFAATHGEKLRFEPQPHKNTVGYWANEKDTAEWTFHCDQSGEYEIDILQGCGKGHGGSQVKLQIADQSLDLVVEETGHFQNFIWRTLGSVQLVAGDGKESTSLTLTPQTKPGGAIMDVRAIRLCPKGSTRTFEAELADPNSLPVKN
ncbi:MAG: hypothetical protein O2856_00885 [Planctomycetota bacterium]|nr:hypothetical protein [Planctomycetota bacterium]